MPIRTEEAHLDMDGIKAAFAKGDGDSLSKIIEEGHEAFVTSTNPLIQKDLVRAILEAVKYEVTPTMKTSTNKVVANLQELEKNFKEAGITDKKVFDNIKARIDAASSTSTTSDGIQKAIQYFHMENLIFRLRTDPKMKNLKMADCLEKAKDAIVDYGVRKKSPKKEDSEDEGSDEEEIKKGVEEAKKGK